MIVVARDECQLSENKSTGICRAVAGMVAIWSQRRFTSFLRRRLLGGPSPSLSLYTLLLFISISQISIFFSLNSIFLRIFPIFPVLFRSLIVHTPTRRRCPPCPPTTVLRSSPASVREVFARRRAISRRPLLPPLPLSSSQMLR